jgi:hypothetical protein
MATANENLPQRRIDDQHPDAKIDWSKPEAPAVPLSNTAGAARQGGITSEENGAGVLTDEQIKAMSKANRGPNGLLLKDISIARAIERAAIAAHLARQAQAESIPDVLFDGKAVYDEIVRVHGTSIPEAVSQTLDAVVRLMRRAAPAAQEAAKEAEQGSADLAAKLEEIAASWDGCEYSDAMIPDIGEALRRDFARLVATTSPDVRAQNAEAVAQFADDFIFCLRKQPNGERWPVGTKLYVHHETAVQNAEAIRNQAGMATAADEVVLSDEECDKIAAQTMDRVAADKNMHALEINTDIKSHWTLRRELIRAGAAAAKGAGALQTGTANTKEGSAA